MAKRFTRRRWRRPQRLTLEGPPPARRKDIVVPDVMTLEPALAWRANRRRMGALLGSFLALCALEGVLAGWSLRAAFPGAMAGLAFGLAYLAAGARFGDRWMRRVLRTEPLIVDGADVVLLKRLAPDAGVPQPELFVTAGEAPNALSLGLRRRWIAVTTGTGKLSLLEREALLARELAQLKSGDAALASVYVLLGGAVELMTHAAGAPGWPLGALAIPVWPACLLIRVLGRVFIRPDRQLRADVTGALVTRYPPGMAQLLSAMAVEHADSLLRTTDAFWAAPRGPASSDSILDRARRVAEM